MQPLSMAKIHLSKRFLESLIVSSVFTFGQEQRKTRSHLVHLSHKQGAFYSCIKLMLVGINTHKNSYGKPVHPLLTAGKTGIFYLFILIFLTARYRFRSLGSSRIAAPTTELAGNQRQIPACTSSSSLSPSSIGDWNWLCLPSACC